MCRPGIARSIILGSAVGAMLATANIAKMPGTAVVHASSTPVSYSCQGTHGISNEYTGYGASNLGNIKAVQTSISYNTDHLIACGSPGFPSYYWTAMVHPQSQCWRNGAIAQAGWAAWYNSGQRVVQNFWYVDEINPNDSTGGCDPNGVILADWTNYGTTYKVTLRYDNGCGAGWAWIQFWMGGGTDVGGGCFDWGTPGTTMQVSTERTDDFSHLGKIGYWYSAYCTDTDGCSPTTAFPMGAKFALPPVDSRGLIKPTSGWSSWNACDYWDNYYNLYAQPC